MMMGCEIVKCVSGIKECSWWYDVHGVNRHGYTVANLLAGSDYMNGVALVDYEWLELEELTLGFVVGWFRKVHLPCSLI